MQRRQFMQGCVLMALESSWDAADAVLRAAVESGKVRAATLYVRRRQETFQRAYGEGITPDSMFLLGSISKPIAVLPLLKLIDRRECQLDDRLVKYLPEFTGDGREQVTLRHLLTHTSGLPDQLPKNDQLRRTQSALDDFVAGSHQVPLAFTPGSQFLYSSMGILLATRVSERITGIEIRRLVQQFALDPLQMRCSAQGLGKFALAEVVPCQTEFAAPEAGGGDPAAKSWDWNSKYWRELGAPWGGTHASASDVATFLLELVSTEPRVLSRAMCQLVRTNQNPAGITPRGLGLAVGSGAGSAGCSAETFGHTGSTGTIAWCDPAAETTCVVLTSLPARAVTPHPRDLAAEAVARK
ncbi:MAG: serine hydrolase domain-containing protein [Planctomycetota bacterium]